MIDLVHGANRPYQDIGKQLIERIEKGHFKVGQRLPAERILAEEMDVSRAIIREAMIMLEILGLVEVRKGSGVYIVALPNRLRLQESNAAESEEQSDIGPFELLQARQVLESQIVKVAATQITKNDIKKLKEALTMERKHLNGEMTDYDGDMMFHLIIAEATQNSVLTDIVKQLWKEREKNSMWQKLHARIVDHNYLSQWLQDHEKIFTCLKRKDPSGAEEAMWQHLENVKNTLMDLSDVDDPEFDGFLFDSSYLTKTP